MLEKIIILVGFLNIGNISHVDSIIKELRNYLPTTVKEIRLNIEEDADILQNKFVEALGSNNSKKLILVVGENAVSKYKQLLENTTINNSSAYVYIGLSQFSPDVMNINIDHVAIPITSVGEAEDNMLKQKKLAQVDLTFAVPNHNPSLDELKTFYANWNKNHSLNLNEKYIFVMLPGDAPTNKNILRYFTKDSAIELAQKVKKLWEKLGKTHTIVAHNSPRTGKHDPISSKVICTHQVEGKEYSVSKPDDYISKIFMNQLQEWKLPTKFYRFVFEISEGKQKPISALNSFYYLLNQNSANILVLPGESVSMMGQAPLYANANQIVVFKPSSMNESHEKLLNLGLEEGYFCKLNELDNNSKQKNAPKKFTGDSEHVAHHIWQGIFKKFYTN